MPKETLPDRLLLEADEVEMVDVTPRALLHRLQRGDIYPKGDAPPIFSEEALSGLRELALREIAGRVDEDVEEYRKAHADARPWAVRDRVMICLTTSRPSLRLIRRGWRMAQRLHADAFCVYVEEQAPSEREKRLVQEGFNLAERLRMPTVKLAGRPLEKLVYFAREKNATHIVLGGSERSRWQEILHGSLINALTRELKNVDILIVAAEAESSGEH
jgi:two-component system sensor histidine kinase KdpD